MVLAPGTAKFSGCSLLSSPLSMTYKVWELGIVMSGEQFTEEFTG